MQESLLRTPAHGKQQGVLGEPSPIDPIEDPRREFVDFAVGEVFTAGQHAAKQNSSIDRRYFRMREPAAGFEVGPVIEKAALVRQLVIQEPHGSEGAFAGLFVRYVSALLADAECSQAKA